MKISYLQHSSFKISGKTSAREEVTLITDPFDPKMVGIPYPKQSADIASVSHKHADHNAIENINGTPNKDYILIDTPGEYEIKGLIVNGIKAFHDNTNGSERGTNTIYQYDFEEAHVVHLGDLGHDLTAEQRSALENVDILFVPIGGQYTISPKEAWKIVESVEPAIVIPMHYKTPKHGKDFAELATLEDFIKESGLQPQSVKDFTLKAHKDLPQELTIITFN